ncbi:1,2-phenylacetyl-CoA epoxidase subunit PaaB [Pseudarthrobacter sp. NamB4]|uniref:1,2-phenylacetyl-CoA epoxidase subunit PaaB n=1 Tax=Pseudarthrobacter sp. NamB4 TaxID=2576837 RepID=UPI0010FD60A0|nr:1,2-phenylacetyl-CoA epoxidase subunit PaaB [Pseudarthrobacter sp. NamB4]TLM72943.1 1,2-phenylacetyl-CoA epoxidase subunit B [Pseudarthrobacter sp. NamB4]
MSPHGNPEEPAGSATDINRDAQKVPAGPDTTANTTADTSGGAAPNTPAAPSAPAAPAASAPPQHHDRSAWGLWEVFVRSSRGLSHVHAGSLHAPDAAMALRNARDLYTRRNEGVSIWVVPADAIAASDPDAKGSFFESPQGKDYRHATYYTKSEGVKHL